MPRWPPISAAWNAIWPECALLRTTSAPLTSFVSPRLKRMPNASTTMHAAARRAKTAGTSPMAAVEELGRRYPKSRWRLRALISQANDYLVKNEVSQYEPMYRTCYQEFPNEPEAAYCHWKVAWASYLRREGSAMFEEHLRLFPHSDKASAALYFLGRRTELASRYPLSYYSTLSRTNTKRSQSKARLRAGTGLKIRLKRAQDLEAAALPEWAEVELQWAAQNEPNSYPAALALAETASRRGAYDVSIRYIKKFAPGYLTIPMEAAPERFWKLAFPLPYRAALESTAAPGGWTRISLRRWSGRNPSSIRRPSLRRRHMD